MPSIFDDPLAAGFIWRIALLIFAWVMYSQLAGDRKSHVWWTHLLTSARLLSRDAEDYERQETIDNSKTLFKWLGIIAILLTLWHGFQFYRRMDPYFLWGPKPEKFTGGDTRPGLPRPVPGAGGGGAIQSPGFSPSALPGQPGRPSTGGGPSPAPPGGGGGTAPGQPGAGGGLAPGQPGTGGTLPGQPGMGGVGEPPGHPPQPPEPLPGGLHAPRGGELPAPGAGGGGAIPPGALQGGGR
jgi:hypothetical protein